MSAEALRSGVLPRRAVFLDRDGVIVIPEVREGRSYAPISFEKLDFYPDAAASLTELRRSGFMLVVVTNQPDVGRGIIAPEVLARMHATMQEKHLVDLVVVCTHTREDNCACKKPKAGMLFEAADHLSIDLAASFMVGDRKSDIDAAKAAGCRSVFIDRSYTSEAKPVDADANVTSLEEATAFILSLG